MLPWVVYRSGRTARYNKGGKALLLLLPSEMEFVNSLAEKNITVMETQIAGDKMKSVVPPLQSLCASDTDLKYLAQKCFISYVRSVFLQRNKAIFDVVSDMGIGIGCSA